jgi:small-conductance mechanosensitive channel
MVRRSGWASDQLTMRWTVQVRWASLLLLLLGLVIVWAEELRTLAISIVAIAAAIVIATKELILCLSGAFLRATSNSFTIGDRIEIAGVRGDVVDLRPLTTTILEIGPAHRRTGRAVILPNALLVSGPVVNETFTDAYVVHMITVPVEPKRWRESEEALLEAANAVCAPFLADAEAHMAQAARRHGLPVFSVEPRAHVQIPDAGKLSLVLRVPTPARDKGQTEQEILRRFLGSESVFGGDREASPGAP